MKKRFLALLLAVSMAVSMLAMPAAALGSASNTAVQTSITLGGMDAGQTGSLDAAVTRGAFARMLVAFSAYRESAASQGAVGTLCIRTCPALRSGHPTSALRCSRAG